MRLIIPPSRMASMDRSSSIPRPACWRLTFYRVSCGSCPRWREGSRGRHSCHSETLRGSHGSSFCFVGWCGGRTCSLWILCISTMRKPQHPTMQQHLPRLGIRSFGRIEFRWFCGFRSGRREWGASIRDGCRRGTWSWVSIWRKNARRCGPWDHAVWNHQNF